ncbi:hypothetical protein CV014_09915 [Nostoc sp. CMAA1605]|nr:hypothetical protein [Nostoc sp. CMAA1605]
MGIGDWGLGIGDTSTSSVLRWGLGIGDFSPCSRSADAHGGSLPPALCLISCLAKRCLLLEFAWE